MRTLRAAAEEGDRAVADRRDLQPGQVTEVDVGYHPRTGRSKVTGTPLGALRAVRDISTAMLR